MLVCHYHISAVSLLTFLQGNHDITLDEGFYTEYGQYFHNQNIQSSKECLELLTESPHITYLAHSSTTVRLKSPDGPKTEFKVFGSPYSPRHGMWAFYYDCPSSPTTLTELPKLWEDIPLDTDVVVTHTPSRTHGDETNERRAGGCEALRQALWRVRPKLAVCGHIHDGRGAERVIWDLGCRTVSYAEKNVTRWLDPGEGSKKLSLVDLTGRKEPSLANDGSHPGRFHKHSSSPDAESVPPSSATFSSGDEDGQALSSTVGKGGDPASGRSDQEALAGRMGRLETCIVNAAIMKSRYPHTGGRQYNKPIIVDLDLPVWHE